MKPTCKAESLEMPPSVREEKDWEKRALRETTGSSSFCLISIKSKVSQCIHSAGGVEVAVNVVNAFESLAIKTSLPNKQIGNRRFTEVSNNFLPPNACSNFCVCRDEGARGTSPVRGATKTKLNNFLCIEPQFFVLDRFDAKVRWLILDGRVGFVDDV
jgi:hypothetical protein